MVVDDLGLSDEVGAVIDDGGSVAVFCSVLSASRTVWVVVCSEVI